MDKHAEPEPQAMTIAELAERNLLVGVEPASGKSYLLNLMAAAMAATGEQDSATAEPTTGPEVH